MSRRNFANFWIGRQCPPLVGQIEETFALLARSKSNLAMFFVFFFFFCSAWLSSCALCAVQQVVQAILVPHEFVDVALIEEQLEWIELLDERIEAAFGNLVVEPGGERCSFSIRLATAKVIWRSAAEGWLGLAAAVPIPIPATRATTKRRRRNTERARAPRSDNVILGSFSSPSEKRCYTE